jgi:hypothetical protein
MLSMTWVIIVSLGCQSTQPHPTTSERAPIVAMLNAKPIYRDQLWPMMSELAGRQALDELILTQLLDQHAQRSSWIISDEHIQSELDALITTLSQSSPTESTPRLIESIRQRRGLGPIRFNALLRRNAILRRMVADNPEIEVMTQQEIQDAIDQSSAPMTEERLKQIRNRARLVAEQVVMERQARELIESAEILIMDRSINRPGE